MQTSPDLAVAQRIVENLRQANMLGEESLNQLSRQLISGDVSATQWRNLVERDIRNQVASGTSVEVQDDQAH
jgi:hypothetical protein